MERCPCALLDVSCYWITVRKKRYGNLKEEATLRRLWRSSFGRGYGYVVTDYLTKVECLIKHHTIKTCGGIKV
jgi:hypothetical protein